MSDSKSLENIPRLAWKRGLKDLKTRLVGPVAGTQFAWALGIAVALTLLTADFEFRSIPRYRVGDIATGGIKAPVAMTVPDEVATDKSRSAAADAVPPVFDLDSNADASLEAEIRSLFAHGRSLLHPDESQPARRISGSEPQLAQLQSQLAVRLGKSVPRELIRVLAAHGFQRNLENLMVEAVRSAMRPGVTSIRGFIIQFQTRGIVLRDISTQDERMVRDVYSIRDPQQARSLVHQKGAEIYLLSDPGRSVVVAYLDGLIAPNISYNAVETNLRRAAAARNVNPVVLQVKKGKILIREGDEITATGLAQLESLRRVRDRPKTAAGLAGAFGLVCSLLLALWRFLSFSQTRHRKIENHFVLISLILALSLLVFRGFAGLAGLVGDSLQVESLSQPDVYYYAAPLGFGAILVVLLVDSVVAVFFGVILASMAGLFVHDYGIMVYALLGSFAAAFTLSRYRERAAIVKCGLVLALANAVTVVSLSLIRAPFVWDAALVGTLCGVLSGIMAAMLASWLLPLLENVFEITTDVGLLELSSLNNPILRRLAMEAPGTYHHSIIVGTLAEAAAEAIGAGSLLVRVGAYYHDIGKIRKPEYYVENQAFCSNKHDRLTPAMSSLIIASHVRDGLEIAEQIKLPQKIKDLIPQHHGTRVMTYFYQKARDAADGAKQVIDENSFRYGGPKPQSREAAILMLADTVEAASRTLTDPTPARIVGLIKHIAYSNSRDGQFDECDITMKDLDLIAHAFMRVLMGMHHRRVEYPGFDFNEIEKEGSSLQPNQRIQ